MAWATPRTWAAGEHPTAAQFNQDIRDNQLAAFPLGVTSWTTWTPTLTNLTLGNGTLTASYQRVGNLIFYVFKFTLGSTSVVGTGLAFSPPVAHSSVMGNTPVGSARLLDDNGVDYHGFGFRSGTDIVIHAVDGASNLTAVTALVPFIWATGDSISISGWYLAA
jgi:hypothetical protein